MSDHDSNKPSNNDNLKAGQENNEQRVREIAAELKELENEENPEWDGSEAEFVSDDDAEEYEIPETGIRLSYVLTQDEMYKCLYHSNMIKTKGARAVIESIILAIASVVFFFVYFTAETEFKGYNLFFGIFCLLMIGAIWIVPHIYLKSMAKMLADGRNIEAEIYPTHIDIGRDDGEWSIELDGTSQIEEFDNIIMIYTAKDRAFAIPERVIEPEVYNEIRAILLSGAEPK